MEKKSEGERRRVWYEIWVREKGEFHALPLSTVFYFRLEDEILKHEKTFRYLRHI